MSRHPVPHPVVQPPAPVAVDEQPREVDLRQLWHSVHRDRWIVAVIVVAALAAGFIMTRLQTPQYQGETTIYLDQGGPESGLLSQLGSSVLFSPLAAAGGGGISTDIAILTSRSVAETVVDSLDLHVQLVEPAVARTNVLEIIDAPRNAKIAEYEFSYQGDGRYSVQSVVDTTLAAPQPSAIEIGRPTEFANVTLALSPAIRQNPPEVIRVAVRPFQSAVAAVRENLTVDAVSSGAQVLSLRSRSADSVMAAAITNVAAASYVDYMSRTGRADARATVAFLEEQVDRYAAELAEAESRLQQFREDERVVSIDDQASAQIRQISDLQARRDLLASEREALKAILVEAETGRTPADGISPYRKLASFPTLFSNGIVQNYVRSLTELETERSEMLATRTAQHPDVRQLTERIEELELQLYRTASNYLQSLDSQIASLDATLSRFGNELETIPAQQIEFARLMRQQELFEEIYTLLETRLKEAEIREAGEPVGVRVLDEALIPRSPVSPRPMLNLILSGIVGLMLGLGAVFGRAVLDPKVRSKKDAIAATGGAPVVGAIPRMEIAASSNGRRSLADRIPVVAHLRPGRRTAPAHLIAAREPGNPVAEAYRGLRTSVLFLNREHAPQVILLTSPVPGEGKSVSASNLALALAQQGTRTLLVDADLRQGTLHEAFGTTGSPGLADVLLDRAALDAAIHPAAVGGDAGTLDVLPSGGSASHPSELLGSPRMVQLLEELRSRYGMVIVDAPPLNVVTDAAVVGALVDCTLLVVRAGTTDKRALADAAGELARLEIPIGGVVVNDIDNREMPYYRYGYNTSATP